MQVKIELPDELGKQLLEMPDMQLLVQKAVEKILLEEQSRRAAHDLLVEQRELLPETSNDEILPITRSLVGILKGSHVQLNY
jgi:antitoxin component of MazEF toxin-antitoxin module